MKLKYLGTAAAEGIPALFCKCETCKKSREEGNRSFRTRSQALINDKILIDFPADSLMHFHKYNIDITDIHTLVITHSHADHFYPIDLTYRSTPYATGVDDTLHVYSNHAVIDSCNDFFKNKNMEQKDTLEFTYVPPFIPFESDGVTFTPLLANHKKDEDCYIYLMEQDKKRILYAHDTGYLPKKSLEYLKDKRCSLVSLDCTMGKYSDGNNHMGLPNIDSFVEQLEKINAISPSCKIVLNHFSHNGNLTYNESLEAVNDKGYIISYDGMEIEIEIDNAVNLKL